MGIPSVTTVLAPWADFGGIKPEVLQAAAERGTKVHRSCTAYAMGLWSPHLPEDCAGYLQSFKGWLAAAVQDVILAEGEFTHHLHGYSGHPDLIVRMRGDSGLTMVDIKTPIAQAKSWRLQLAAYVSLAESSGHDIDRVIALRLRKTGASPIVNEYTGTLAGDLSIFLSCLQAWKYFKGA